MKALIYPLGPSKERSQKDNMHLSQFLYFHLIFSTCTSVGVRDRDFTRQGTLYARRVDSQPPKHGNANDGHLEKRYVRTGNTIIPQNANTTSMASFPLWRYKPDGRQSTVWMARHYQRCLLTSARATLV